MTTTSPVLGRTTPATLSEVVRRFWWPVYGEARSLGRAPADAWKITSATLGRAADAASFLRAEGHDGRLRLLIRGELSVVLAKPQLLVHAPGLEGVSTELAEARDDYSSSPDSQAFNRRWAIVIQEAALRTLQEKISFEGHAAVWLLLKPFLSQRALNVTASVDGKSVTVEQVERMRERYRFEVRRQVAETVTTPLGIDSELAELFGRG